MKLEFQGVEVQYPDGTRALKSVTLVVPAGEICVLLGASGAGKSTLLRCVNGLTAPSAGHVSINGVGIDRSSLRQLRRHIGTVHQSHALSSRMSVAQNVLSGAVAQVPTAAALLGLFPRRLERKAAELIAAVGLGEEHLARRAASLSGGQQQRVGIARALITDPEIILADEPVASLDPKTGADIVELLAAEARRRSATLLCSLHQVDLARRIADRIVGLSAGEVVLDDTPDALTGQALARLYQHGKRGNGSTGRPRAA